jgi:putative membrane protein
MMAFILIWIIIFMIYFEKEKKKSILILILAGFLGLATFDLNIEQPLLPLLTGLFGTSTIINSIKTNSSPPKQIIEKLPIEKSEIIKPTLATILISPICSLLPGLGSAQAATIGSTIFKKLNKEQFMILLGSINTLVISTSFITLYLFEKNRTGAAAAISQIANLTTQNIKLVILVIIISSIISIPIALFFSKLIAKNINKINYKKASKIILIFLIIITASFSGFYGILVLTISTLLGLLCLELGTKRSLLMSSILIPTIIFYLPF